MQLDQSILDFIEALYRKKSLLLYHYAKTLFDNPSIAEEAVQETFIVACINYEKLQKSKNPEGWIMNTHKNVCRNIQKTRNYYLRKMLSLDESSCTVAYEEDFTIENDLENFVTSEEFYILKKIILDGYSHKDLSIELGISIDASKKRFQRAKEHFKKNFQK